MTITIGLWIIPTIISAVCIVFMIKPSRSNAWYTAVDAIFDLLWLIPALAAWVIYLALASWIK